MMKKDKTEQEREQVQEQGQDIERPLPQADSLKSEHMHEVSRHEHSKIQLDDVAVSHDSGVDP